jgi:hypothetical protein
VTTYSEWTKQVGDAWVAALKRAEDGIGTVSTGVRRSAARVDLPPVQVPEQFSRLSEAMSGRLPKPAEIVEANFELTTRLLEAQRELTLKLLESATPEPGRTAAAKRSRTKASSDEPPAKRSSPRTAKKATSPRKRGTSSS